jgi:iron-sulfur cluster insertion protein
MNINFTDAAVTKIKEIIAEDNNPAIKLRVFVQGGGCSGFQYGFTLDEVVNDDDHVQEKDGVQFLVDSMSLQYLVDATVDFVEDLTGAMFKISNPNATTTCGCGSSFSA